MVVVVIIMMAIMDDGAIAAVRHQVHGFPQAQCTTARPETDTRVNTALLQRAKGAVERVRYRNRLLLLLLLFQGG